MSGAAVATEEDGGRLDHGVGVEAVAEPVDGQGVFDLTWDEGAHARMDGYEQPD
jgi:hypothetical protein